MNSDLENKLYAKYPQLFQDKDLGVEKSCMAWGLECGDGWYTLIDTMCASIESRETNIKAKTVNYTGVKFEQVKEKFGGLRVYFSGGDDYIKGIISFASDMSYTICENCGNKGSVNKNGWITVLCQGCGNG